MTPNTGDSAAAKPAPATAAPTTAVAGDRGSTATGQSYGAGVDDMDKVPISNLVADPTAFEGKTVQVEGMVTDVCAKRGCWFELAGAAPGEKVRFKVADGEMVFPMSAKGKRAVAQGTIVVQKLSLDDTRAREAHFAKESGREFDPASITEGKTVFQIKGTGAVIRD